MTSTEMLTQVRTLLDEESEGFYEDSEIYSALTNGQKQVVNFLIAQYEILRKQQPDTELPEILNEIAKEATSTVPADSNNVNVPSDYLHSVAIKYSPSVPTYSEFPVYERKNQPALYFKQDNSLLVGDSLTMEVNDGGLITPQTVIFQPYYTIRGSEIIFDTTSDAGFTGSFTIIYISEPLGISSGENPELPDSSHDAIIKFAAGFMLQKDELLQQSQQLMDSFTQILPTLYY